MGPADAITTAVGLTRTTAITRAGRPRAGVTAHPRSITLTRIGAVIPMLVTTTTIRTTRQPPAITRQWLQLCSGGLANSVTTTAESTESLDRRPAALSPLSKAGTA